MSCAPVGTNPEKATKILRLLRHLSCEDKAARAFSPWKREVSVGTFQHLSVAKRATRELEGDVLQGYVVTQEEMA